MTHHKNLKRLIRERQARTGESYSTARSHLIREPDETPPVEHSALLALLANAGGSFQSVEWTYRVWRHRRREAEGREAARKQARSRGGSGGVGYSPAGLSEPGESVETTRFWRDGDRLRIEFHGGPRDGFCAVAADGLWWKRDPRVGTFSNGTDPSLAHGFDGLLGYMLDPAPLLDLLEFTVIGRSLVAGRSTITAHATALPPIPNTPTMRLYDLGAAADLYELEIDRERGVLLGMRATREGQPMQIRSTLAIGFDEPIPSATFAFEPLDGEDIHPPDWRPAHWGEPRPR